MGFANLLVTAPDQNHYNAEFPDYHYKPSESCFTRHHFLHGACICLAQSFISAGGSNHFSFTAYPKQKRDNKKEGWMGAKP